MGLSCSNLPLKGNQLRGRDLVYFELLLKLSLGYADLLLQSPNSGMAFCKFGSGLGKLKPELCKRLHDTSDLWTVPHSISEEKFRGLPVQLTLQDTQPALGLCQYNYVFRFLFQKICHSL